MFAIFNNPFIQATKTNDPASLDNLHDLVEPSALPMWPPALGWYLLATGLLVLLIWGLVRAIAVYLGNAYRRAALAEIEEIRLTSSDSTQKQKAITQLNQLLNELPWQRGAAIR